MKDEIERVEKITKKDEKLFTPYKFGAGTQTKQAEVSHENYKQQQVLAVQMQNYDRLIFTLVTLIMLLMNRHYKGKNEEEGPGTRSYALLCSRLAVIHFSCLIFIMI